MADQVDRRLALLAEERRQPVDQLLARRFAGVALGDLHLPQQHVAQHAVRMERAARMGAPQQQPAGVQIERLLELGEQPALAEPGLADDRERARLPLAAGGSEGGTDDLELGFAADHLRVHALDATTRDPERARLGTLHQVAAQRLLDSLDLDRAQAR